MPLAAAAQAEERWTFALTPYLWLPNVNGTLKYNPPPSGGAPEVDTGPNNYLENLSFALMLSGEARKGRWSILSDLIYLKFYSEKSNVRDVNFGGSRVNTSADVGTTSSLKGLEWTIAAAYAMQQSPHGTLEVLGGLRYFHVEASSEWQLNATVSAPPKLPRVTAPRRCTTTIAGRSWMKSTCCCARPRLRIRSCCPITSARPSTPAS